MCASARTTWTNWRASESDAMQILEFVPLSAVDPIYFESTYYLVSEKLGAKAYWLLAQAMETMGRVALAKFVGGEKRASMSFGPSKAICCSIACTTRMKFARSKWGLGPRRNRGSLN